MRVAQRLPARLRALLHCRPDALYGRPIHIRVVQALKLPATVDTSFGPSVEGAGAPLLAELLVELEIELERIGFPVGRLRPGLPRAKAAARFAALERPVPDELLTWFEWHNGATMPPDTGLLWIVPGRILLDLDEVSTWTKY